MNNQAVLTPLFILKHSVVALNGPVMDSTRPSHPFVASLVISSRSSEGGTVVQRQIKTTRVAIGNAARPTLATSNSHLEHHSRLPLQRARHDFGVQQKRGQPARLTACFPVGIPADIKPATPDSLTALVAPRTSAVLPAHREARPARLRADADDRMLAIPLLRSARHASRPHACRFRPRPSIRGRCPPKKNLKREEVVSQRAQSNPSYGIPRDHHPHPLTSVTPASCVLHVGASEEPPRAKFKKMCSPPSLRREHRWCCSSARLARPNLPCITPSRPLLMVHESNLRIENAGGLDLTPGERMLKMSECL